MRYLRLANEDQTTVIDLLRDLTIRLAGGFDFMTPGQGGTYTYEPYGAQFAFGNFQPQTEAFDLVLNGSTAAIIAASNRLQDFLEAARLFHAGDLAAKSCWLEWSADGESPKRSLLYSGTFKVISQDNVTPGLEECRVKGVLSLSRHPLWEVSTSTQIEEENLSDYGGKYDYTNVPGNTLARAWQTLLYTWGAHTLYRFWVGIRRFNQGVANFEPMWECEDGTNTSADATDQPDGTASGGNMVQVDYSHATTLHTRMTMTVLQACAAAGHTSYNHQQGRYLVLLRCKLSAAGTSGIQLRSGYTGNILADEIFVDNTDWRLIPLGDIAIPPWEGNLFDDDRYYRRFRLDIYSEQLTAGHNLLLDCFVLIPNEHLLTVEGANIAANGLADYAYVMEDDQELAFAYEAATLAVYDSVACTMTDWYLPPGSGTIIVAAEDATHHDLAGTVSFSLNYHPRWSLYRGT